MSRALLATLVVFVIVVFVIYALSGCAPFQLHLEMG
jgi:hypothetical protein